MVIRILYIDDEISEPGRAAQYIQSRLEVPGTFEVELKLPPKRLPGLTDLPDALMIDLDLTTAIVDGETINYFGSTLASEMRMRYPACPIILITKPNIITEHKVQIQLLEDSIDVDFILDKDRVIEKPTEIRTKITSLIAGFQALGAIEGNNWLSVLTLMQADPEEAILLREAASPVKDHDWTVPQVARWIRRVVMRYPGILYDEITAATKLGIDATSFYDPSLQDMLEPAKYKGIFNDFGERWWRTRLYRIAQQFLLDQNLSGPVHLKFSDAFSKRYDIRLAPAICVYDQTPVADWVCYILQKPVKLRNSIPYYPDGRPEVMDQARVSFTAIDEEDEFDEHLVDAESYTLVKERWGID